MTKTLLIKTISTFVNYYAVKVLDDVSATDVFHDEIADGQMEWIDSKFEGERFSTSKISTGDEETMTFIDEAMPYVKDSWTDEKKLEYVLDLTKKEEKG
jgi:hypothetical protein